MTSFLLTDIGKFPDDFNKIHNDYWVRIWHFPGTLQKKKKKKEKKKDSTSAMQQAFLCQGKKSATTTILRFLHTNVPFCQTRWGLGVGWGDIEGRSGVRGVKVAFLSKVLPFCTLHNFLCK